MSDDEFKYKSEYTKLSFYYIGGRWGYALIRLIDSNKAVKLRIAKCKKQDDFPKTDKYKWIDVPVKHVYDLSQVQKINFKPTDNFENISKEIIKELAEIKKLTEEKKAEKEEKKEVKEEKLEET